MILLTCKNHPTLRWMRKPPEDIGRSIFFLGEVTEDGHRREECGMPNPVLHLRCRLEGKNVYAPSDERLNEKPMTDWDDVLSFVKWVEHNRKRYAFECLCPASDLEIMRGPDGGYVDASEFSRLPEVPREEPQD